MELTFVKNKQNMFFYAICGRSSRIILMNNNMVTIFKFLKKWVLPQHRAKRKLQKYIRQKNRLPKIVGVYLRDYYAIKYSVEIGVSSKILLPIEFPHPRNICIGENVSIGTNCVIFQDVTIGQKNEKYPTIGNNCIIYPGAKVIGGITIGNNVIIGANSVVTKDVEDNTVVAGNPAKRIG